MASFDLNLLGALDVLLAERNVTRAAERLHVTQPTMSGMLQRLRWQFEDPILVSVGRYMELTPLAASLIAPTRDALRGVERLVGAESAFDLERSTRAFTLMASDYCVMTFMPSVIRALTEAAPGIRIDVRPLDSPGERLASGEVDLCISIDDRRLLGCEDADDLQSQHLFSDRFVSIVDADRPLDAESSVADYFSFPHIGVRLPGHLRTIDATCLREHMPEHRPCYTVADFSVIPHMVTGSRLVGIVQKRLADAAVATIPVKAFAPPFTIPDVNETMFWDKRHDADASHLWLRRFLAAEAACWCDVGAAPPQRAWIPPSLPARMFAQRHAA
jgi:DNA-binding transcriptional LysR family regulator